MLSVQVLMEVASSNTSRNHLQERKAAHPWSSGINRWASRISLEMTEDSKTLRESYQDQEATQMSTNGIKRHTTLNSLMWLKCVLYLKVLQALGDLTLESFVALELTPVHHLLLILITLTHTASHRAQHPLVQEGWHLLIACRHYSLTYFWLS